MSDNWVVQNLENALEVWNDKLSEIWQLITQSPQTFKGGSIWSIICSIHGALQAIGYEEELRSKNARLVELDTLLNIDGKGQAHAEAVVAKSTRPSVLDHLKRPVPPRSTDKKPKQHEEVR